MSGDEIGALVKQLKSKDFLALSRLLSIVERRGLSCLCTPELLQPKQQSFRLGITGPPGAGKSTLIGQLIGALTQSGMSVGVIAVDPSSPFSRGAILGDRIRYTEFLDSDHVFVRSLGSRGSLGGLSAAAYLMLRAYDIYGFDIVLIETVGVGQTELEVMNVADSVAVVLVPESGDSIQAMKAGLLEIADIFLVNKADRPGSEALVRELEASVQMGRNPNVEVLKTVALKGEGISELLSLIFQQRSQNEWQENRQSPERLRAEALSLLRMESEKEIVQRLSAIHDSASFAQVLNVHG